MLNLVSNAIRYRSPDRAPVVSVSSYAQNSFIVLEVVDNGIGIDLAKHKSKIFSLFKRISNNIEGSGVGLFLVKRIVDFNGGKVEVDSTLGKGSTFRIYFPKK